uniref:Uncharacterized protein n=1 Tax=Megaselia scalaris TaxID=36166 RepID=T1GV16_MEGSC
MSSLTSNFSKMIEATSLVMFSEPSLHASVSDNFLLRGGGSSKVERTKWKETAENWEYPIGE